MGLKDWFKGNDRLDVPAPPSRNVPDLPKFEDDLVLPSFEEKSETFEDRAVKQTVDELEIRDDLVLKKPIFVELPHYKMMMGRVVDVNSQLIENEDILFRLSDFQDDIDKEYVKFRATVSEIQKKLIYAERTLFK